MLSDRLNTTASCSAISQPRFSNNAMPLCYLTFNPGGLVQHWGIFLAAPGLDGTGTFWELTFAKDGGSTKLACASLFLRHGTKRAYTCKRVNNFDMGRALKGGCRIIDVENAFSTPNRVEEATTRVMKDFKYEFLHENCQTFAIDTLKLLRDWDPTMVSQRGIDKARSKSGITVRATTSFREKRTFNNERPRFTSMSQDQEPVRDARSRATITSTSTNVFDPAITVLPRDSPYQGVRNPRTRTVHISSTNVFNSDIAVEPIRSPQQQGLANRTLRKGARTDPLPRSGPTSRRAAEAVMSEGRVRYGKVPGAWM